MYPALFMLLTFSAQAEILLTQPDILGSWSVDKESINRDGRKSKALDTVWTFNNNGTLVAVSHDSQTHARVGKFRAKVKYRIESGKLIKQVSPGRSREETCITIEKEGSKMLLKCSNIYFFMTKK
jgi:hypothetical protein